VTRDEAASILQAIRNGRELRIYNIDGEWGIKRDGDTHFEEWAHPPYEEATSKRLTWDDALELLLIYSYERMSQQLRD
jgi:hypothetical protein